MNLYFNKENSIHIISKIKDSSLNYEYDHPKHRLIVQPGQGHDPFYFRLPVHVLSPDQVDSPVTYLVLIIQSGSCALGLYQDGINVDHKVFSAYMVRKKQGMSQIKYLKTKGKSRAGSRVRLAGANLFFENINERLNSIFDDEEIHRIAFSCSKILIPHLFNAKVDCPFDKNDSRIFKIPKHIHTPNHEVMTDVHKFLLKGELIYEESQAEAVRQFLDGFDRSGLTK